MKTTVTRQFLLPAILSASKRNELVFIVSELKRIKNSNFGNFHTDVNWMKHEVPAMLFNTDIQ